MIIRSPCNWEPVRDVAYPNLMASFRGDRWFSEPATSRFIDLCTLAKISMLALMDKYHGYYLHCRSSHTVRT